MNDNYDTMSLKELKQYCRDNKYKGHSKCKNKNELKEFIKKNIELESVNSENNIICGKCGERGHHSYKCINNEKDKKIKELEDKIKELELKMCFEDPIEESGSNEEYNNNTFTFDEKYDETSIKINILEMEDKKNKNKIEENNKIIEELQNKCDTLTHQKNVMKIKIDKLDKLNNNVVDINIDKRKRDLDNKINEIKKRYNVKIISNDVSEWLLKRYQFFIDHHRGHGNQIILFHGTDEKNIKPIMENGFSLTTNKQHGSVYGDGLYFTPNIDFAIKYPKDRNPIKNILVVQVYVNNIMEGKSPPTFPKMPNSNEYYDTCVDNRIYPNQYIKKSVEDINIIAHIQINLYQNVSNYISNNMLTSSNSLKTGITIINNSSHKIYTYWNPDKSQSLVDLDINKCKIMGYADSKNEIKISTYIGETFILGYFDKRKYYNIYKIITVTKIREQFDIK